MEESLSSEGSHRQQKAVASVTEGKAAAASSRTWQIWPYGAGFKVEDTRKGFLTLLLQQRKITEARYVLGVSLREL